MRFVGPGACMSTWESSRDHVRSSAPPAWEGSGIRTAKSVQAGEHSRFLPPYTEIFPGWAMLCMAYFAITQIKSVYVLHAHSQS